MHGSRQNPGREAGQENDGQGQAFFEAEIDDQEEEDAGQQAPQSPFGQV